VAWLDLLDEFLRPGARGLGGGLVAAQITWLERRQAPGGGFPGRAGPPDAYYTDFALRALDLIAPDSPAFAAAASFIAHQVAPADVVGAFSLLSCARVVARDASRAGSPTYGGDDDSGEGALDHAALSAVVEAQSLAGGGSATTPGSSELSAYRSFLGALCREMLGTEPVPAARALRSLRRESGGFAERADEARAQTNATAATMALLAMEEALTQDEARSAANFLASMQSPDGGLRAHADAPEGDLLSTFTGLLTLSTVGGVEALDLPAVGRFVRAVARSVGGFGATVSDPGADVEYAYYGLATLALLRTLVEAGD